MLSSATRVESQSIVSLKDYIAEQAPEKPYRFVVIYNDPSNVGDDSKEDQENNPRGLTQNQTTWTLHKE